MIDSFLQEASVPGPDRHVGRRSDCIELGTVLESYFLYQRVNRRVDISRICERRRHDLPAQRRRRVLLGAKIKLIQGYKSSAEIRLAMARGQSIVRLPHDSLLEYRAVCQNREGSR